MEPLLFDPAIAEGKPHSVNHDPCPFCQAENLTDILDRCGDMIWLLNKYPVMPQTKPTVLIETAVCEADITTYTPSQWETILRFGLKKWQTMMESGEFASVIFYRNFGPFSGGSIRHPHSQIIGMYMHDYRKNIDPVHVEGETIVSLDGVRATLSDYPIGAVRELNVTCPNEGAIGRFSRLIQDLVCWVCDPAGWGYGSYNLFFYDIEGITCKIVPRSVSNPFFHGYRLAQAFVPAERKRLAMRIGEYVQSRLEMNRGKE